MPESLFNNVASLTLLLQPCHVHNNRYPILQKTWKNLHHFAFIFTPLPPPLLNLEQMTDLPTRHFISIPLLPTYYANMKQF